MFSISIGPLTLSAYTISVALGVGAGLAVLLWSCRRWSLDEELAIDALLGGMLLGIVAARAGTVLTALDYFLERPSLAFCLRQGGLGARTLLAVLVCTYALVTIRSGRPWRDYLAALTPALATAAAVLWLGALFWGGFAGRVDSGWVTLALPDEYGVVAPRLPIQAVMAAAHALIALWSLSGLDRTLPRGASLAYWGASTSALTALLGNFRHQESVAEGLFPGSIVADAALTLVWLVAGVYLYSRRVGPPDVPADATTEHTQPAVGTGRR